MVSIHGDVGARRGPLRCLAFHVRDARRTFGPFLEVPRFAPVADRDRKREGMIALGLRACKRVLGSVERGLRRVDV